MASLVAQRLKHLPLMWETWVRSLGWEDPLEKEMATHSSVLVWRIPWMGATVHGVAKSWTRLSDFTSFHFKLNAGTEKGFWSSSCGLFSVSAHPSLVLGIQIFSSLRDTNHLRFGSTFIASF